MEDRADGFAGLRLHRRRQGRSTVAAEVIFWDATGQYFLQTLDGDVPLAVIEELIAEARARIRVE